jgi:hypothetical protein
MKRLVLPLAALLAACPAPREEKALRVVIELAPGLTSKCLQLELDTGALTYSDPLVLTGKTPLIAGIPQEGRPDTLRVRALGFSDERCRERASEESDFVDGTFGTNPVPEITLRVTARTPMTETACANGADDDRDGLTDCVDPNCNARACASDNQCLVEPVCLSGTCQSASVRPCSAPPTSCFNPAGACVPSDGGCAYVVSLTNRCDDLDACTLADACQADGGCGGTPLTCPMNTTQSCRAPAGACADGGCVYAVTPDAGCDDGERCTIDDRCADDGTCTGSRRPCPPRACAAPTGQCDDGGTCLYQAFDAGTPCDGGVCSLSGDCLPRFPYPPTNFDVVQLRAPPPTPTVLDCGETIIDTTGPSVNRPTNWCNGQPYEASLIRQDGGGEALLVSLSGLTVTTDGGLRLVGDKPVIFAVFGDVNVYGTIVAEGGDRLCAGTSANGGANLTNNGGGAGGSFSTQGGAGGDGSFASGGTPPPLESNLGPSPLRGGCRGGRGGDQTNPAARGGGGVQLSSAGQLSITGAVAAPGRGGAGGVEGLLIPPRLSSAGNGGGAGGLVVLEAVDLVIVGGAVTANGGGGGEGAAVGANGGPGATGAVSTATPAPGGSGMALTGGGGGNGAAGATAATSGPNTLTIGGGGGGGLGVVYLRGTRTCDLNPNGVYSPPANPDGGCS